MREDARLPDDPPHVKPSFLFDRWPRFASRHPWLPLAGAAVILMALAAAYVVGHGEYGDAFNLPGAESQQLTDMLQQRFPGRAGEAATIVVSAPAGLDDPRVQSRVRALLAELAALPDVVGVSSPYESPGAISPDRTIARISVQYSKTAFDVDESSARALMDLRQQSSTPDFQVEAGGAIVWFSERRPPETAEAIGLAAAIVILLIAFGSVVAMGLPIVTALLALASGFFLVGVGASLVTMPSFTSEFTAMIGIGVGIDYSLLIVTRFREARASKLSVEEAIVQASATAGRSVVFAGSTVVIALLGLWAVGIPFVGYVGAAAALFVALSVLVAVCRGWPCPCATATPASDTGSAGWCSGRPSSSCPGPW